MLSVPSVRKLHRLRSLLSRIIGRESISRRVGEPAHGERGDEKVRRTIPRKATGITLRQVLTALSLALFERPGTGLAKTFELDKVFDRAGMNVHPIKYGAETIMWTVLSVILTVAIFSTYILVKRASTIELLITIMLMIMIPIVVFAIRLAIPYMKATDRRNNVENELPFFMAYVSTMVKGGLSLEMVVARVSQLKIFRGIREECRRVVTRMRVFGEDPITALDRVVLNHPSSRFRDVILGYTTTLRSGGDVSHYLETRTREIFESRMSEIKTLTGRMLALLEVYMVLGVVISLTVYVFTVTSSVISAAQAGARPAGLTEINVDLSLPIFYNFVVLPLMGLLVAVAIHVFQPKTSISYNEVYVTLLTSVPVSIVVFLIVLAITGGAGIFANRIGPGEVRSVVYATAALLVTISIPPAIKYTRITRRQKGLIRAVSSFLRDISEIRKTGLSPEKCIILVSNRDYRSLKPVVEKTAVSLMLGLNLEEALRRSLRGIKDWFTVTIMKFLVDSIIVGGGSPEVIDTLARFTQVLSDLEEETRRRMRLQIILPYLGTALLSTGPVVLLYMLTSLARIPIVYMMPLVLTLSIGCLLNAYLMGLVAGKAMSSTVAAGFLHTILLTVVTVATLSFSLFYIG